MGKKQKTTTKKKVPLVPILLLGGGVVLAILAVVYNASDATGNNQNTPARDITAKAISPEKAVTETKKTHAARKPFEDLLGDKKMESESFVWTTLRLDTSATIPYWPFAVR